MDRMKTTRWLLAAALLVGCGDDGPRNLGDNDAGQADVPGLDAGAPTDTGSPTDTGPGDTGSPTDTGPADAGSPTDTGPADAGSPTDTGPADAGSPTDTGPADAGSPTDTGPADAGAPTDTGPADAGAPTDTGPRDAGPTDAGPADAGPRDAGAMDAGAMDAGPATDGGPADTGVMCTPATETCNGRDDDCDGIVDESGCGTHLVISEVAMTPETAEFVEVHNPTSAAVTLTNVYLADTAEYACRLAGVTCMPAVTGAIVSSDFVARFPAGATVPAGQYRTVSLVAVSDFRTAYGRCPDFYLRGTADPMCPMAQLMLSAGGMTTNTIGSSVSLTNGGEPVVLFSWDQTAPRVVDLDYVVYGNPSTSNPRIDKSGLMSTVSGMTATYLADTPSAMQATLTAHTAGRSNVRCDFSEGTERRTGGNGAMGHDETSENWGTTWRSSPVPGDAGPASITPGAENNCR